MYMLFAYESYYPSGGWNDLIGTFPNYAEAKEKAEAWKPVCGYGSWHIVSVQLNKIVSSGDY